MPDAFTFDVSPPEASESAPETLGNSPVPNVQFPLEIVDYDGPEADAYYARFGLAILYFTDEGLRAAPKAATKGTEVSIWRQHGSITYKVVVCEASKLGSIPLMPHIDAGTSNEVLLSRTISPETPEDLPDGQKMYSVKLQYVYVCLKTPEITDPILVPNSVLRAPAGTQINPAAMFSRTLAGPSLAPAGFSGRTIGF